MRRCFPNVDFQPDSVLTDQGGVYSGGGTFSSLNLVLYLVEKFCGHEIGVHVAKNFSIHRDHINQAHFSVFRGLSQHGDRMILDAQAYIETHYAEGVSVEHVAGRVNMSKRNFIRRFKRAVQIAPLEYIQRVKIEAAKKALELGQRNIQALTHEDWTVREFTVIAEPAPPGQPLDVRVGIYMPVGGGYFSVIALIN